MVWRLANVAVCYAKCLSAILFGSQAPRLMIRGFRNCLNTSSSLYVCNTSNDVDKQKQNVNCIKLYVAEGGGGASLKR